MTPSRILVLGGTSWLGGATARIAQDRGHAVTCLARGRSGQVPDGVRLVAADRREPGAYDEVAGRDWDAVIEVSWQPELVRSALSALAARAEHWVYVSSVSVYADHSVVGVDESAPTHQPWAGTGEAPLEEYGPAKVSCETAFADALTEDRLMVARAGLIAGYGDRSDRFGYWPARIADVESSGEVVLMPPLDTPVQVIDVQDLAGWLVAAAEKRTAGTFDAVGDAVPFEELAGICTSVADTDASLAPASQEWLLRHGVTPWAGPESLPLWLPVPEYAGTTTHRNNAAKAAGLSLRPLEQTVRSALAWERELGRHRKRAAGLSVQRERQLLEELAL